MLRGPHHVPAGVTSSRRLVGDVDTERVGRGQLVAQDQLDRASAVAGIVEQMCFIVAPVLAGGLVAGSGT